MSKRPPGRPPKNGYYSNSNYDPQKPFDPDDRRDEDVVGYRIGQGEGDGSFAAPPPQTWTLNPIPSPPLPPILNPLSSTPGPPSLLSHALYSILSNITSYASSSFSTLPSPHLELIFRHLLLSPFTKGTSPPAPPNPNEIHRFFQPTRVREREVFASKGNPFWVWMLIVETYAERGEPIPQTLTPPRSNHDLSPFPPKSVTSTSSIPSTFSTRTETLPPNELLHYLQTSRSPLLLLQSPTPNPAATPQFHLLTTLSIYRTNHLNSHTILSLRSLTSLSFLFLIECQKVDDDAVAALARTLFLPGRGRGEGEDGAGRAVERRGPYGLRGVWLDGCRKITRGAVVGSLVKFPLLNVISVRQTAIIPIDLTLQSTLNTLNYHNLLRHPNNERHTIDHTLLWAPATAPAHLPLLGPRPKYDTFTSYDSRAGGHVNRLAENGYEIGGAGEVVRGYRRLWGDEALTGRKGVEVGGGEGEGDEGGLAQLHVVAAEKEEMSMFSRSARTGQKPKQEDHSTDFEPLIQLTRPILHTEPAPPTQPSAMDRSRAFYNPPSNPPASNEEGLAPTTEGSRIRGFERDIQYMLVRSPPPWSVLEEGMVVQRGANLAGKRVMEQEEEVFPSTATSYATTRSDTPHLPEEPPTSAFSKRRKADLQIILTKPKRKNGKKTVDVPFQVVNAKKKPLKAPVMRKGDERAGLGFEKREMQVQQGGNESGSGLGTAPVPVETKKEVLKGFGMFKKKA